MRVRENGDARTHNTDRGHRLVRAVVCVAGALLCAAAMWIGVVLRRPYLVADRMAGENRMLEQQALEAEVQTQRMRRELAILQTPAGQEREARKLGYVRKGESLLIIPE